mmetsp:Transcript_8328/g.29418  ORF Transcript_8328/g.29418 Transcript_8328/m.29418 type:complete len:450 (-) Transcript_8328:435-1784(-)
MVVARIPLGLPVRVGSSEESAADRAAKRAKYIPLTSAVQPSSIRVNGAPASPDDWFYDWFGRSPLDDPAVESWLRRLCAPIILPAGWFSEISYFEPVAPGESLLPLDPNAAEAAALDVAFSSMVLGSRADATLSKYRIPFIKMMLWLALRGLCLSPPAAADVGRYLAFIVMDRRNKSAAVVSVRALAFVAWLNSWGPISSSPHCALPMSAAVRAFSVPTKKAAALEAWHVAAIVKACCRADSPDHDFMFGTALVTCFMLLCRYDDLKRLCFAPDRFEVFKSHIRFFLETRKTDQNYGGQWIDIAAVAPSAASFDISCYDLVLAWRARARGVGPVLRRIYKRNGTHLAPPFVVARMGKNLPVGAPLYMARQAFVVLLRQRLVSDCGLTVDEATFFSAHSPRAGGATEMVKQKVPDHIIQKLAGTVGADWIKTYDRVDLARRLAASATLGF